MKPLTLKRLRILVSLVFFALLILVFIDFSKTLPEGLINTAVYLQFVPSLLKFIGYLSFTVLGFIIILIITSFTGRVYCSSICPLGTFQDLIIRIRKKFTRNKQKKRRMFGFRSSNNVLRYGILVAVIIFLIFGESTLLILLDPYSIFGRFVTGLINPLFAWIQSFGEQGMETGRRMMPVGINTGFMVFSGIMMMVNVWMSLKYGRLYCNSICPVGSLLGFISKFSFIKLHINAEKCNGCGNCAGSCKSECIDKENKSIDFSRCVMCFNCLEACTCGALSFQRASVTTSEATPEKTDLSKRAFMFGTVAIAGWLMGMKSEPPRRRRFQNNERQYGQSKVPVKKEHLVTPPGSDNLDHFNQYCTACTLCVSACPSNVIQPTLMEHGAAFMLQPMMDFSSGFCKYDCRECSEVCPTGAIKTVHPEEKKTIQIGIAKFVKENCVIDFGHGRCGDCAEVCPTNAITMVPDELGKAFPHIDETTCIGCGACEFICKARPNKAIYVEGNVQHQVAEKLKGMPKEQRGHRRRGRH